MKSTQLFYWGLLYLLSLTACSTEDLPYRSELLQLPTQMELTDICWLNTQEAYISAGRIFDNGLVLHTLDAGQTWDTLGTYSTGVNSLSCENGALVVSESGNALHVRPAGGNWLKAVALSWWAWKDQVTLVDDRIFLIGGENFGRGFLHEYQPVGNSLKLVDTFEHELRSIVKNETGTLFVAGYGLVMRSEDAGATWQISDLQGDFFVGLSFPTSNIGYVAGTHGAVYKTTDAGASWTSMRAGNSIFADLEELVQDVAFFNEEVGFLVGTKNMVYRTTDGGRTWKKITNLGTYTNYTKIHIQDKKAYLLGDAGKLLVLDLEE